MTDEEIENYLIKHHYEIDAQDAITNIFNKSHQIINKIYDYESGTMTITTPDNTFRFKWLLREFKTENI